MGGHPTDNTPEKPDLRLGFIPLTDSCLLAVAREMGYFEKAVCHGFRQVYGREDI
ncbi:MAG: ABC transporter substrate-binding protein [Gammaproteobacteria bacterium]